MAENVITNANDVELVLESGTGTQRGTAQSMGRIVVDEFSLTKEEDDELVSGVGFRVPGGITNGDITYGFSFTMMGQDVSVFEMVSESNGESRPFSFTARKTDDNGNIEWEASLDTAKATSEEISASSGDAMEYAVEGIGVSLDKTGLRHDGQTAWDG